MLITRIKTAAVLLALVTLVLFVLPAWSWILFCSVLAALGFWEWLRLTPNPYISVPARIILALIFGNLLAAAALAAPVVWMGWLTGLSLLIGTAFWLLIVPLWLVKRWVLRIPALHFLVGFVLIVPAWCVVFRPHFVVATHYDEDGVLVEEDEERKAEAVRAAA